jgi:hypothetical protein
VADEKAAGATNNDLNINEVAIEIYDYNIDLDVGLFECN